MALEAIEERCAVEDWNAALDLAIAEWRRIRSPGYADLVDAISAKTTAPPLAPRQNAHDFHRDWLERAARATARDVVPLLSTFADQVEGVGPTRFDTPAAKARARSREEPCLAVAVRLELLAARGPDPRVAKALLRFLRLPLFRGEAVYRPVLEYLVDLCDVRVLPGLERLLASPPEDLARYFQRVLPLAIHDLRELKPPAGLNATAVARRLGFRGPAAPAPSVDVTELFEMIVASPDDDDPREVLADRWLEAGDPRGEFVQLQLRFARGHVVADEMLRMTTLQYEGESTWLGDLAVVTCERDFCRGFLEEFALSPGMVATSERWAAASRDPRLGTVRRLRRGEGTAAHFLLFLHSPAMRSLEEVEFSDVRMLVELLEGRTLPRLRRITIVNPHGDFARAVEVCVRRDGLELVRIVSMDASESLSFLAETTPKVAVEVAERESRARAMLTPEGVAIEVHTEEVGFMMRALEAVPRAARVTLRAPRDFVAIPRHANVDFARLLPPHADLDAAWREALAR